MSAWIDMIPPEAASGTLAEMYERFVAHLKANEIDVDSTTLGPWLEVDRDNECFRDHDLANELAHGYYRDPYIVPDLS